MATMNRTPGGPWQVALVDDDLAVLRSLSRMLTLCGYDVTTFPSADAFLSSLDRWQPEVLLVDLRMPDTDGLALQAALVDRGIRIPTVFLSGHGDVATSVRAIRAARSTFSRSRATSRRCSRRSSGRPTSRAATARRSGRVCASSGAGRNADAAGA